MQHNRHLISDQISPEHAHLTILNNFLPIRWDFLSFPIFIFNVVVGHDDTVQHDMQIVLLIYLCMIASWPCSASFMFSSSSWLLLSSFLIYHRFCFKHIKFATTLLVTNEATFQLVIDQIWKFNQQSFLWSKQCSSSAKLQVSQHQPQQSSTITNNQALSPTI